MGYLQELRREREARNRPAAPRVWSDQGSEGQENRFAMESAGILEVFELLKEKFRFREPSVRSMCNGATRFLTWDPKATHTGDTYTQTYRKICVDLTTDGDFIVRGRDTQTIARAEYEKNPDAVSDALRRAVDYPEQARVVTSANVLPHASSGRRRIS